VTAADRQPRDRGCGRRRRVRPDMGGVSADGKTLSLTGRAFEENAPVQAGARATRGDQADAGRAAPESDSGRSSDTAVGMLRPTARYERSLTQRRRASRPPASRRARARGARSAAFAFATAATLALAALVALPSGAGGRRAPSAPATPKHTQRTITAQRERVAADRVETPRRPAAAIRVPLVRQALRNNCETAALSMLLAAANVSVSQLELQRRLPRSGPLDPIPSRDGGLPIWGDPDRGFVGRAAGGGTSGGFGVYQEPIRQLAGRYGVDLRDLSGAAPTAVFRALRSGHPVMVWVGLSEGPYKSWRTPSGRRITVNFGEHTVVLTGLRGDTLQLNDPLTGTRATWTRAQFVKLWNRLGRRALTIAGA